MRRFRDFVLRVESPPHVTDQEAAVRVLAALSLLEGEFIECSLNPEPWRPTHTGRLDVNLQPEDQNHA